MMSKDSIVDECRENVLGKEEAAVMDGEKMESWWESGSGITELILQPPRNHSLRKRRVWKRKSTVAWSKQRAGIVWDRSDMHGSETRATVFEGHNDMTPSLRFLYSVEKKYFNHEIQVWEKNKKLRQGCNSLKSSGIVREKHCKEKQTKVENAHYVALSGRTR